MAVVETIKHKKIIWTNIIKPDHEVIDTLRKKYKFHPLDLEDCLSKTQRPKIDDYEKYLFIVLHLPSQSGKRKSIEITEINIFIGQNYLITINHDGNKVLNNIFEKCSKKLKTKKEYMGNGTGFLLYMIIKELFDGCFPFLDKLALDLTEIEKDLFEEGFHKDLLRDISLLNKDIINFRRIVMPQRTVIAQLEHKNKKFLPENLDIYFDDVVDKIEKIWNNLETSKELITSLHSTNESFLSHNINNVMKVLTIFSVIMLPLTFITGVYGMNISTLPLLSHPESFFIISGIMAGIILFMLIIFKWKKWI